MVDRQTGCYIIKRFSTIENAKNAVITFMLNILLQCQINLYLRKH